LDLRLVLARVAAGEDGLDLDGGDDALDLGAARFESTSPSGEQPARSVSWSMKRPSVTLLRWRSS
jgi:hypothetical protein